MCPIKFHEKSYEISIMLFNIPLNLHEYPI